MNKTHANMQRKRCPVCDHVGMEVFVEIGNVPVHCCLLWPSRESALKAPRGTIQLGLCASCGMIYNLAFDPSRMQYIEGYENSLHFSPHFQAYAQELATRLIETYQLYNKDIIEIGCGKGEFLSLLCQGGQNRGLGFDPSYEPAEGHPPSERLTFIRDVYSEVYAQYRADLVCCRQVLEHLQHPYAFLQQLQRTLLGWRDPVVFFEVPNTLYSLRNGAVWDLIYEHCSYFSPVSLARLFTAAGFHVLQLYETYDGQFLCIEASPVSDRVKTHVEQPDSVQEISNLISAFATTFHDKIQRWRQVLGHMAQEGRRLLLWGAGARGVSFLNMLGVHGEISHVVDINPRKQGKHMTGTGQLIVAPEFLKEYHPDTLVMTNPIYEDEIRDTVKGLGLTVEFMCA